MANTHHTGIPLLQWAGAYPPCTPSVVISADINPFCAGDSVTFTPSFLCITDVVITAYAWVLNGSIVSASNVPYVTTTLVDGDTVYLLFVTSVGNTYYSNVVTMVEATSGCVELGLELTFDNIVNAPVANPASVSDWNTLFDLPTNGTPFTSVEVTGNVVNLIGGSGITIVTEYLGANYIGYALTGIVDNASCVVAIETNVFTSCLFTEDVIFPAVVWVKQNSFTYCTFQKDALFAALTSIPTGNFGTGAFEETIFSGNTDFTALQTAYDFSFWYAVFANDLNFPALITARQACFEGITLGGDCIMSSLVTAYDNCFRSIVFTGATSFPLLTTFAGVNGFLNTTFPNDISLPSLATTHDSCFENAVFNGNIYLPSVTSLGLSVLDNSVFLGITGKTFTLTIPTALMTCNSGNPDGDIQYLNANNTLTIVQV